VKYVAMETNVCCHGDHVRSSLASSLDSRKEEEKPERKNSASKSQTFSSITRSKQE